MNKAILRLAIPNILSNISVPLLSSFDTALMGRLSAEHLGAVGLGAMIFNFVYWNFGFLRMGSTGMTAQAYGQGNSQKITTILTQALTVACGLALLLLLLQRPFLLAANSLLQVGETQRPLVASYFYIRIWAAPAALGMYALFGWFFGMQNATFPLILTIVINVINMVVSYILVYHMDWGIAGVAWGTVVAQYAGLLLGLVLLAWRYNNYLQYWSWSVVKHWRQLEHFVRINSDIFLRTLCLTLAFALFYRQSSELGATVLAVNVILLQYVNWMSYGVDGFAFAAESLVGKYYGAQQASALQLAIKRCFQWGLGLALIYAAVYYLGGTQLLGVFTNQQAIKTAAIPYLWWMILFPLLGTPCYIWDGIYIGLTAAPAMRNTMILAFVAYLICLFSLGNSFGNHGLWAALLFFMVARGIMQWYWWQRGWLDIKRANT